MALAIEFADAIATFDHKEAGNNDKFKTNVLVYTTSKELNLMAEILANDDSLVNAKRDAKKGKDAIKKKIRALIKKNIKSLSTALCTDAADIALFGRMVASASDLTLEGAAMFSHAISTHKADNEIDFFSALDDLQPAEETGAGMIGTLEFNAATYYRFCALNLDMLADEAHLGALSPEERQDIVAAFVEATLKAMPIARKNSMNANTMPAHVLCVLRDSGQPVQLINAFEKAVYSPDGKGYVEASAKRMDEEYQRMETVWGLTAAETIHMPQQGLGELLQGVRRHVR